MINSVCSFNLHPFILLRYMNFFPKQTELYEKIFEVSSTYFESTVASYRANSLLKIAKIIIVLPDPVQRAYKHYMVKSLICIFTQQDSPRLNNIL